MMNRLPVSSDARSFASRWAVGVLVGVALVGSGVAAHAETSISGIVRGPQGTALDGVIVSARAKGSIVTTSVYTNQQGKFSLVDLPKGRYVLWAQAVGLARTTEEVDAPVTKPRELRLTAVTDPEQRYRQLPADVVLSGLPQSTKSDKQMVHMLRSVCAECHSPAYVLQPKFDERGWLVVLNMMEKISVLGPYLPDAPSHPDIKAHKETLAKYLARVRGPDKSELQVKTPSRPSGDAVNVTFREYWLPLDPDMSKGALTSPDIIDGSNWAEGVISAAYAGFQPHDAVADFDGNLWFVSPAPSYKATFGRVDAKTGEMKLIPMPGLGGFAAMAHGITTDLAGNVWTAPSTGTGKLVKIDPKTQQTQIYTPPVPTGMSLTVDAGADGRIWQTSVDGLVSFDPKSLKFQYYSMGTKNEKGEYTLSYGVAADGKGDGWWTMYPIDMLGRGNFKDGTVTRVPVADMPQETHGILKDSLGLRRMGGHKYGKDMWVAASYTPYLVRVDVETKAVSTIQIPNGIQAYHIVVARNGDVWFNTWMTDKIVRYVPGTKQWTFFELPTRGGELRHLSLLEREGKPLVVVGVGSRTRSLLTMTLNK